MKTKMNKTKFSVPEQHQRNIAKKTLKMNDVGANIMGGMTKEEARRILGIKPKYTILVEAGKPYDIEVESEKELKTELARLKKENDEDPDPYFDVNVINDKDEDITESQFIQEMIGEIMGEPQ